MEGAAEDRARFNVYEVKAGAGWYVVDGVIPEDHAAHLSRVSLGLVGVWRLVADCRTYADAHRIAAALNHDTPALPDRETLRAWLIRTTKHPSGTKALWWGPDECGYTTDLDAAGLYTAEDVRRILGRSPLSTGYLAATVRSLRVPGQVSVEAKALVPLALPTAPLPLPVVRTCGACGWYTVHVQAQAVCGLGEGQERYTDRDEPPPGWCPLRRGTP